MKISDQSLYTIPSLYKPANPSFVSFKCKKESQLHANSLFSSRFRGEGGIRTPGTSQFNGFQDRRNRPLCHLSKCGRKDKGKIDFTKERFHFFEKKMIRLSHQYNSKFRSCKLLTASSSCNTKGANSSPDKLDFAGIKTT